MSQKPILFSTKMVQAILDGHKTQTRRVIKPQFAKIWGRGIRNRTPDVYSIHVAIPDGKGNRKWLNCPYGKPSGKPWVIETWATVKTYDNLKLGEIPKNDRWPTVWYKAPLIAAASLTNTSSQFLGKVRPSIFMPRWASRITLKINKIRVERLQDISDGDAKREGIRWSEAFPEGYLSGVPNDNRGYGSAYFAFRALWDSINAARGYGWNTNPWVWVVEFERL